MSVFIPAGSGRLYVAWSGVATLNMTLMGWVWLPTLTPSTGGWRDMIVAEPNIYLQTYSDGTTLDFGTHDQDHTSQALAINTWYHFCQVVVPTSTTNRQVYGYMNGELLVNVADTTTFGAYTGFTIGNNSTDTQTYALNGNVRDVKIWNRALTPNEIVQEMQTSRPIHDESLLVWSPLDDDLYTDRSGNGRIWTAYGTPAVALQYGGPRGPNMSYVGRSFTRF